MSAGSSDFLTTLKNAVTALGNIATRVGTLANGLTAQQSSGTVDATTLIREGRTRILGVSVIAGSADGLLYDVADVGDIDTPFRVFLISSTPGWYPLDIVVERGLAFEPGTGMVAVVSYSVP